MHWKFCSAMICAWLRGYFKRPPSLAEQQCKVCWQYKSNWKGGKSVSWLENVFLFCLKEELIKEGIGKEAIHWNHTGRILAKNLRSIKRWKLFTIYNCHGLRLCLESSKCISQAKMPRRLKKFIKTVLYKPCKLWGWNLEKCGAIGRRCRGTERLRNANLPENLV